ncbi:hypothetical protein [Leucobacter sp. wl10]|uniref:hypothetical protein n=1 Tax=Leucobacter sp. wl10 TaxID=2304677 RepID=UPI000E5ADDBC|nr:hypothetical protein [Leucobacter sp. wl10]RGE19025.1 hypothetical protein D1J51_12920 [Leucobacter sp. wl10]
MVQYILLGALMLSMLPLVVTLLRRREPSTRVLMVAWVGAFIGGAGSTFYIGFTSQPWALLPAVALTVMLVIVLRLWQGRLALSRTEDPEEIALLQHRHGQDLRLFLGSLVAVFVFGVLALVMGFITR